MEYKIEPFIGLLKIIIYTIFGGMCVCKNTSGTGFTPQSLCRPRRHLDLISYSFHLQNEVETQTVMLTHLPGLLARKQPLLGEEDKIQQCLKHNRSFSHLHFVLAYLLKVPWKRGRGGRGTGGSFIAVRTTHAGLFRQFRVVCHVATGRVSAI